MENILSTPKNLNDYSKTHLTLTNFNFRLFRIKKQVEICLF